MIRSEVNWAGVRLWGESEADRAALANMYKRMPARDKMDEDSGREWGWFTQTNKDGQTEYCCITQ